MADKKRKSQAEMAAAASNKKKKTANKTTKKPQNKTNKADAVSIASIPIRFISSAVCLVLFIVLLSVFFWPEGYLPEALESVIHGLIGRTGFVVAIPAVLYLFYIHAFSGSRPIRMRTICIVCFVVLCGSITQLVLDPTAKTTFVELYPGGILGSTGGLICGGVGLLTRLICGPVLSYVVLIVAAVFTLLGGMQITIPSIIRAIQNRPRPEWDDGGRSERQEPAAVVVNHIASKRIAYIEKQRRAAQESLQAAGEEVSVGKPRRAKEIIKLIDVEVEKPIATAVSPLPENHNAEIINDVLNAEEQQVEPVSKMPLLKTDLIEIEQTVIDPVVEEVRQEVAKEKVTAKDAELSAAEVAIEIAEAEAQEKPEYCFPPINLLNNAGRTAMDGTAEMRENTKRLNETLASFKIEAHIINVTRGPSVTRYDVELEKGVRLSKLTTAADDIALSLGATGVRIAAVPGKISVVGIEVPNRDVTTVSLREVIDSTEFEKAKSKSSFSVGKDIAGNCVVGNIAKLPHMLIAGTTGSGKSVCMNSIIISLLYKASPDDVKLIMVDPKMVELGVYNGIPHLLIPVVTDPKKAAGSLQWAVTEMMRRYRAMSDAGVRDLESYNSIMEAEGNADAKLPQVVVIIDELADLMLVAAKEVEESICRIAQMGRASGIHLVIATQRPSADVITGLMKANIPSRIAFAVASAMESRIILDTQGAEKLVGKGDMLYAPIGCGKPKRVQGCFVSEAEVEAVASYVKANYITNYDQQVMEEIEKKAAQTGNKPATASEAEPNADETIGDEMLPAAVDVILETGQASVSMLQRRLKLGYARAARIVDEMEERGIVGPFVGSKPRAILVTKEQWEAMRNGQTNQMQFDDLDNTESEDLQQE